MRTPRKAAPLSGSGPEAILPLTDFRADPWKTGVADAVAFRAGVMSSPVPAEFAAQARGDGRAAALSEHPKPPKGREKPSTEPAPEKQG